MFRGLKQKIGDGIANSSTARSILSLGQTNKEEGSSSSSKHKTSRYDADFNGSQRSGSFLDLNSSVDTSFHSSYGDVPGRDSTPRSRSSSISSQASDASFFSPQFSTPSNSSAFDFDESASEVESVSKMNSLSKDDLFQMFNKVQRRGQQYKTRYLQVITGYKELQQDCDKLKETLSTTQDKAIKRISELKERIKLDSLAKKNMETKYISMLDEKEEMLKSLQLQMTLVKEEQEFSERSLETSDLQKASDKDQKSNLTSDVTALRGKVKRLEDLLTKCKETITNNKEKIQQLSLDRESILKDLDSKTSEVDKMKESNAKYQSQLKEARKVIEDLETDKQLAIASAKQELHNTLELKENELVQVRLKVQALNSENLALQENVRTLEKTGQDQKKEFSDVIKKLEAEKLKLEDEMMNKIQRSEKDLEHEKDTELQELRRSKVEALQVLQKQMQDKIAQLALEKEAALVERDKIWEIKVTEHDKMWKEKLAEGELAKQKEFEARLSEKLEEMYLAVEEQELQKMAAVKLCDSAASELRNQCDLLMQENRELQIKLENCQQASSDRIGELMAQMEQSYAANKMKLEEIAMQHEMAMQALNLTHQSNLETLHAEYSVKLQELNSLNDKKLQDTTNEIVTSYERSISDLKETYDVRVKEYQSQVQQMKMEIETLEGNLERGTKSAKETKGKTLDEILTLKIALAEVNDKYVLLTNENDLLRAELSKNSLEVANLKLQISDNDRENDKKLESSVDTINHLEQRINDLMERENQLNTELEQTKVANEHNLMLQDAELKTLRELTDNLKRSEKSLTDQLNETNEHFQAELARINFDNMSAMSQFSGLLQESQSEMGSLMGELLATKQKSNEIVADLEKQLAIKSAALQDAYKRLGENDEKAYLQQRCELDGLSDPRVDKNDSNQSENSENRENRTSEDERSNDLQLLHRVSELENCLLERDQAILYLESKIKEFGVDIQRETVEMRERSKQVELLLADKDQLLKEKDEMISQLNILISDKENKIQILESSVDTRRSDFEELQGKFWQLQTEAKSRLLSLKERLIEKDELLRNGLPSDKQLDVPERILQLQEEFLLEKKELEEKHKAEVKNVMDTLEMEKKNSTFFKDGVRQQFEERQMKVKIMMEKMKDNFEQSLLDRDNLLEIKLANLEREKNLEKQQAMKELTDTIEKLKSEQEAVIAEALKKQMDECDFLKAKLESAQVSHRQTVAQYQAEKEALMKYSEGDNQLLERLKEAKREVKSPVKGEPREQDKIDSLVLENDSVRKKIDSLVHELDVAALKSEKFDQTDGSTSQINAKTTATLEAEIEELRKELENLNRLYTDAKGKLSKMESESREAVSAQRKLESEKKLSEEKITEMEHMLKSFQDSLKTAEVEMERNYRSKVDKLESDHHSLQEELKKVVDQKSDLEKLIENCELEKLNDRVEITELKKLIAAAELEINVKYQSKVDELENSQLCLQEELKKMLDQNSNLEKLVNDYKLQKESNANEMTELRKKFEVAEVEFNSKYQSKVDELEKNCCSLQDELKKMSDQNSNLEKLVDDYKLIKESNANETTELRKKFEVAEVEFNSKYQSKVDELERNCCNLQDELKKMSDQNSNLEKLVDDFELQKMNHEKEVTELRERLEEDSCERLDSKENKIHELEKIIEEKDAERQTLLNRILEMEGCLEEFRRNAGDGKCLIDKNGSIPQMLIDFDASTVDQSRVIVCDTIQQSVEVSPRKSNENSAEFDDLLGFEGENVTNDSKPKKEITCEKDIKRLHQEYKARMQEMEEDHNSKVFQLIKDFNVQLAERERELSESYQQQIESLEGSESRLRTEHKVMMHDINSQLKEADEKNKEHLLMVESKHKSHIDKLNSIVEELHQTQLDKEHEWTMKAGLDARQQLSSGPPVLSNSNEIESLRQQIHDLNDQLDYFRSTNNKDLHRVKQELHDDLLIPGLLIPGSVNYCRDDGHVDSDDTSRQSTSHQANNAGPSISHAARSTEQLTYSPLSHFHLSFTSNSDIGTGCLLAEPTELEYLKNVLYKYMLGLETRTLARVICTVMKFSEDQMKKILDKEDSRSFIFRESRR